MALQGAGTELDPFLITNLAELRTEVTNAAAYYKVTQDLDVRGTQYEAEWTECTIACLQLDFDNKKIRNITTALNNDIFKYNCASSTIVNANFENITCNKHMFGHVTSYTTMTNLNILNSSFSVKWGGNTAGYGLFGIGSTTVDSCEFKLKISGTVEAIFWTSKTYNRVHVGLFGNFTLLATQFETFSKTYSNFTYLFRFPNHCTKIYLTGNAEVKVPANTPFLFFANERNTAYAAYGYIAYYAQCYVAIKCNFTLISGTAWGSQSFARSPSYAYWPPANFVIADWLTVDGVPVPWGSCEQVQTYVVTELQAKSASHLSGIGFDVSEVV
jgi:hypothetical protein